MNAGRCSVWLLTRPLRTTAWVMVQAVHFLDRCIFSAWLLIRPLRTTTWYGPDSTDLDKVVVLPVVFMAGAVLGKVVDTPVVLNDMGHGPDSAVPGQGCCYARFRAGFLARSLTRPLCSTTGVMVQTVQFWTRCCYSARSLTRPFVQRHVPKVVETVQLFDKVIDVPVLCTTGAYGGRLLFLRQVHRGPDV